MCLDSDVDQLLMVYFAFIGYWWGGVDWDSISTVNKTSSQPVTPGRGLCNIHIEFGLTEADGHISGQITVNVLCWSPLVPLKPVRLCCWSAYRMWSKNMFYMLKYSLSI
jgi:hypothetical protein